MHNIVFLQCGLNLYRVLLHWRLLDYCTNSCMYRHWNFTLSLSYACHLLKTWNTFVLYWSFITADQKPKKLTILHLKMTWEGNFHPPLFNHNPFSDGYQDSYNSSAKHQYKGRACLEVAETCKISITNCTIFELFILKEIKFIKNHDNYICRFVCLTYFWFPEVQLSWLLYL